MAWHGLRWARRVDSKYPVRETRNAEQSSMFDGGDIPRRKAKRRMGKQREGALIRRRTETDSRLGFFEANMRTKTELRPMPPSLCEHVPCAGAQKEAQVMRFGDWNLSSGFRAYLQIRSERIRFRRNAGNEWLCGPRSWTTVQLALGRNAVAVRRLPPHRRLVHNGSRKLRSIVLPLKRSIDFTASKAPRLLGKKLGRRGHTKSPCGGA